MTSYIPSITLPGQVFATPAASILLPVALGTAVGFSIRRKFLLSVAVTPCLQHSSNEHPRHLPSAQAATLPSSTTGIRPHVDSVVWLDGILRVQSMDDWHGIAEPADRRVDQGASYSSNPTGHS